MNQEIIVSEAKALFERTQTKVYSELTPGQALLIRQFQLVSEEELEPLPESAIKYTLRIALLTDLAKNVHSIEDVQSRRVVRIADMTREEQFNLLFTYNIALAKIEKVGTAISPKSFSKIEKELTKLGDFLLYQKYFVLVMLMIAVD